MSNPVLLPFFLGLALTTALQCQPRQAAAGKARTKACCCSPGSAPEPLSTIHAYLCGFHFYAGDPARQLAAHHYCAPAGPEVMQCVIYDGNGKGARLVGVEYIISARRFHALPEEEKLLWHSHRYEVKSGQLVAPALDAAAEKAMMKDLVSTYGKTWQTWQVDRNDQLPMGIPQLLMGFTADGQAHPGMVAERDRALGVATADRKAQRADLPAGSIEPGADAWERGGAVQLELGPVRGQGAGVAP